MRRDWVRIEVFRIPDDVSDDELEAVRDLDRLLQEETGLPVIVAEDPLTCVVRGCGDALEHLEKLGAIFIND